MTTTEAKPKRPLVEAAAELAGAIEVYDAAGEAYRDWYATGAAQREALQKADREVTRLRLEVFELTQTKGMWDQ